MGTSGGRELCRPGTPGPFRTEWNADDPQTYRIVGADGESVAEWGYALLPVVEYAKADTRDADALADTWERIWRADAAVGYCDALIALAEWEDAAGGSAAEAIAKVAATLKLILTEGLPPVD